MAPRGTLCLSPGHSGAPQATGNPDPVALTHAGPAGFSGMWGGLGELEQGEWPCPVPHPSWRSRERDPVVRLGPRPYSLALPWKGRGLPPVSCLCPRRAGVGPGNHSSELRALRLPGCLVGGLWGPKILTPVPPLPARINLTSLSGTRSGGWTCWTDMLSS